MTDFEKQRAKEKGQELVNKFLMEVKGADRYNYNLESMNLFIAKQCALIAVDEIIESLDESLIDSDIYWWKQVKKEIEEMEWHE